MFFSLSLYAALLICLLGLAYKVWTWLTTSIGPGSADYTPGQRVRAALKGMAGALFSPRIVPLLKTLALDGLLQRRSFRVSRLAWSAHLLIYAGFLLLLVAHALGGLIIGRWTEYYPTLNPYLFLRNLAGLLLLAGVALVVYRRLKLPGLRLTTRGVDRAAIALLAVIMLSGFWLEAGKILSPQVFGQMVSEWADAGNQAEVRALQAFWGQEYGVAFPGQAAPPAAELLAQGRQLNQQYCANCHSAPQWAAGSYLLSRAFKPAAAALAAPGLLNVLYYVHFLACWLGLALLPFSKFLHLFTTPLLLMINAVSDRQKMDPANRATVRALELDACMHCAVCSIHCSVAVALRHVPNLLLLPSEKLAALDRTARGRAQERRQLETIREGCYICSSCYRCTRLCTAGINLQDLWFAQKDDLLAQAGLGEPYVDFARAADQAAEPSRSQSLLRVRQEGFQHELKLSAQAGTFSECYRCQTCTNVCPVVFHFQQPKEELDLLPHQIMHSLGLGLREEAMGARMVWRCLTCYHCQEACPMGVKVTDVLFELRNLAAGGGSTREEA